MPHLKETIAFFNGDQIISPVVRCDAGHAFDRQERPFPSSKILEDTGPFDFSAVGPRWWPVEASEAAAPPRVEGQRQG